MKIINILNALSFTIIFSGCSKNDDVKDNNGIIITKKSQWSIPITDDDSLADCYFLKDAIIYQDQIIVQSRKQKNKVLKMVNAENGETKWEWNDFMNYGYTGVCYPHIYSNKLTWQVDFNNYQLDLISGKTIWKNNYSEERFGYWSRGLQDFFFVEHLTNRNLPPLEKGGEIVIMDNNTGKPISTIRPKYDTTGRLSFDQYGWDFSGTGVAFIKNNENFLLIKFKDPPNSIPRVMREYLSLYNLTQKKWVYERQKLKSIEYSFGTPHPSIIFENKVYHGGQGVIVCHDLMTGNKLWETPVKSNYYYQSAGLLVDNGRVYANSDGGQLVCIDANSGVIKWDIRSSGSSTALSYLNGVVYFVGGGDGKLHAVDAETGDYLWKIESPDKDKNKWAIFWGMCGVVPGKSGEKGRIVVTTGLNAYCYEAIR